MESSNYVCNQSYKKPSHKEVYAGSNDHAESVKVTYDPKKYHTNIKKSKSFYLKRFIRSIGLNIRISDNLINRNVILHVKIKHGIYNPGFREFKQILWSNIKRKKYTVLY